MPMKQLTIPEFNAQIRMLTIHQLSAKQAEVDLDAGSSNLQRCAQGHGSNEDLAAGCLKPFFLPQEEPGGLHPGRDHP